MQSQSVEANTELEEVKREVAVYHSKGHLRRRYPLEFKRRVVALTELHSVGFVARSLNVSPLSVGAWKKRFDKDRGGWGFKTLRVVESSQSRETKGASADFASVMVGDFELRIPVRSLDRELLLSLAGASQ